MKDIHKLKGGIFGLLVGDALGVPYEFHEPEDIPPLENIEMTPPEGFMRAHSMVKPATWSDDGAQALCLLDSLVEKGGFDLEDFSRKILAWYDKGLWAVGGRVFDVGIQTGMSLDAFRGGVKPEKAGLIRPDGKGNAHRQCLITHGNITNQVCCALYVLMARELLKGNDTESALDSSAAEIRRIYADKPEYSDEFEFRIRPEEPDFW